MRIAAHYLLTVDRLPALPIELKDAITETVVALFGQDGATDIPAEEVAARHWRSGAPGRGNPSKRELAMDHARALIDGALRTGLLTLMRQHSATQRTEALRLSYWQSKNLDDAIEQELIFHRDNSGPFAFMFDKAAFRAWLIATVTPKQKPGPKHQTDLDREIRRRLEAGEQPGKGFYYEVQVTMQGRHPNGKAAGGYSNRSIDRAIARIRNEDAVRQR